MLPHLNLVGICRTNAGQCCDRTWTFQSTGQRFRVAWETSSRFRTTRTKVNATKKKKKKKSAASWIPCIVFILHDGFHGQSARCSTFLTIQILKHACGWTNHHYRGTGRAQPLDNHCCTINLEQPLGRQILRITSRVVAHQLGSGAAAPFQQGNRSILGL